MTVSFDKKLAELDAYLQMLIEQTAALEGKIKLASGEVERDGLILIKHNLESLVGAIKHSIVLLQIAKVSIGYQDRAEKTPTELGYHKETPSTSDHHPVASVRDGASVKCSLGGSSSNDDDFDDDDAFFDAADEQQQPANISPKASAVNEGLISSIDNILKDDTLNKSIMNNNTIDNPAIEDGSIDWDALYEEEEEDLGSLENQGSVIKHLMSQIRIGMDLTKVVLPTFILERRSLLEMYADFFAHPDLFSSIPDYETPEERMIQLVRWYLSAFHAGRKSSVAKKPYNPILGEIFLCHWNLDNGHVNKTNSDLDDCTKSGESNNEVDDKTKTVGRTDSLESRTSEIIGIENFSKRLPENSLLFVAEQVSHHPPVSAFYAENKAKQISCCSHIYTKSKYLGLSVGVHNLGQGSVKLMKHNETYVCTFPSAYGRSILTVPWVELGGSVNINCEQTGYSANIEFVTKPFYGGKKHRIAGEILRPNKVPFMSIEGEWNGVMYSKSPPNSGNEQVFVDTTCLPVIKKHVRSISSQESFESRNVWKEVTRALKLRDVTSATAAKSFIEQRQRDLLKDRTEKGSKWQTRYFEADGDNWTFARPLADK